MYYFSLNYISISLELVLSIAYINNQVDVNRQQKTILGLHFTNIKTAKEIEHKLRSYLHHREFDVKPLSVEEIDKIIKNKQAIYDLKVDKKVTKIGNGNALEKFEISKLPNYIQANKDNLKEWID